MKVRSELFAASGVTVFFAGLIASAHALVAWMVAMTAETMSRSQAQIFLGLGILGACALMSGLSLLSRARPALAR